MKSGYFFTFSPGKAMKKILLFGAGKSATVLIDYLLEAVRAGQWQLTVVDANKALVESRLGGQAGATAASFDIQDEASRQKHISDCDLVISLLPAGLHQVVARDCLRFTKH